VPFNTLKGNTKDIEKQVLIDKGRPGSSCPNKYIALNKEFKETGTCTASREYQYLKIKELEALEISSEEKTKKYNQIIEKSCICVGLGTSTLLLNNSDTKKIGAGVSICPGPNMAYYSKVMSLKEITDHIYGRKNMITRFDRPNMFIKELTIYIEYLENKVADVKVSFDKKQQRYLTKFKRNLEEGIRYYTTLFSEEKKCFVTSKEAILVALLKGEQQLKYIGIEIENLK
jgi:hypothetical protein